MSTVTPIPSLPIPCFDPEAELEAAAESSLSSQQRAARTVERAAQTEQRSAVARQVSEMRDQADFQLGSSIVQAAGRASTAIASAAAAQAKADADYQTAEAHDTSATPEAARELTSSAHTLAQRAQDETLASALMDAAASAGAGALQRVGAEAGARATEAGAASDRARQAADDAREDRESAARMSEKALDHGAAIADARSQAHLAATRA